MLSAALAMPQELPSKTEETHTAERMADAIQECMKLRNGPCGILEVMKMGLFTLDEIARYWPEANSIVQKKSKRPGQC